MKTLSIKISMIALAAGLCTPGQAQTAAPAAAPTEVGLQDIIVTAQKRPEVGQKAPLAVTSIDAATLASAHINGATDLQRAVPNLTAELGGGAGDPGGGNTIFTIRGLGSSATGPQGSSGVAAHFDGVYRQDGISNAEFFDLERIEVDPGPQGTLYGRSAAAGAINIIPAKPTHKYEGAGSVSYGNYQAITAQAMINLPIGDTLALRITRQTQTHDGYYTNGYDDQNARSVRAQLLFTPSKELSVRVYGSYTEIRGVGAGNVFVGGNPALYAVLPQAANTDVRKASIAEYCMSGSTLVATCRQSVHVDKVNLHAEISYDFGGAVLTVIPAYTESRQHNTNVNAPLPISKYDQLPFNNRQTTFEARLSDSGGSKLKWVVGGNYYDNKVETNVFQAINVFLPIGSPFFPPLAGVPCVVVTAGGGLCTGNPPETVVTRPGLAVDSTGAYQLQDSRQESYAFFGQATYPITEGIRLTLGARYNHDKSSDVQVLDSTSNLVYVFNGTGPFANPLANLLPPHPTPPAVGAQVSFNAVTYRAAIDADVGPHSIVYASVGSGYKPGGLNDGGPASTSSGPFVAFAPSVSFGPEKVTHFEVGSKNRFLGNTLQINNVIYYDSYNNYQNGATQVVNPVQNGALGFVISNAGKARVYGDELSIKWQISKHDELDVSANYLNAKFTSYTAPAIVGPGNQVVPATSYAGFPLPNAPEFSGNVSYRHTFDLGSSGELAASAFSHLADGYWVNYAQAFGSHQSAYTSTTLDLTWTSDNRHLKVSAFVNNVENHNVIVFAGQTNGYTGLSFAPPRTYGGSLAFKF